MPSLHALGLDVSPSKSPEHYPGTMAQENCVLTRSWLYRLKASNNTKIGSWLLDVDGGPWKNHDSTANLDEVLSAAGVALMRERLPTLAVGSNASPGQLASKFGLAPHVSDVVPLTRVTVAGLGVGHSAHISKQGYIPYAPMRSGGSMSLFMLWLDPDQLAHIDKTEPNYKPMFVKGSAFPAQLDSGEIVNEYSLYRGRWGVLRTQPLGAPALASTQEKVIGCLAAVSSLVELAPGLTEGAKAATRALAGDEDLRVRLRDAVAAEKLVASDGL